MSSIKKYMKTRNEIIGSFYTHKMTLVKNSLERMMHNVKIVPLKSMKNLFIYINKSYLISLDQFLKEEEIIFNEQRDDSVIEQREHTLKTIREMKDLLDNNKTGWVVFYPLKQDDRGIYFSYYVEKQNGNYDIIDLSDFKMSMFIKSKNNKEFNEHILRILLRDSYFNNKRFRITDNVNFETLYISY